MMNVYIGGFTVINVVGVVSFPAALIRSLRPDPLLPLLPLLAAGYALSWFFFNLWHHAVGDLRFGYYVWTLSFWGIAYGLARVRHPQKHQQPVVVTDESGVWPPPPIARR